MSTLPKQPTAHLDPEKLAQLVAQLQPGWEVGDGPRRLTRRFKFHDFKSALHFVNRVGVLAEELNHHPDIELGWGRVVVSSTTHSVGALTSLDFELARRVDGLRT